MLRCSLEDHIFFSLFRRLPAWRAHYIAQKNHTHLGRACYARGMPLCLKYFTDGGGAPWTRKHQNIVLVSKYFSDRLNIYSRRHGFVHRFAFISVLIKKTSVFWVKKGIDPV